jgi:hypothetical protein
MFPGLASTTDATAIFDHFYRTNAWGTAESVSGPGSTLAYTTHLRTALPRLVHDLGVHTLLDAPCGDVHSHPWRAPVGADWQSAHLRHIAPVALSRRDKLPAPRRPVTP